MPSTLPTDIAKPTIAEALDSFLVDQEARLSHSTFARYREIVSLLQLFLNDYGANGLDDAEERVFHRHFDAEGADHRDFCEIFGPDHIAHNLQEFLGDFMIRKVAAGVETIRAAGPVTKKLVACLAEKAYIATDDASVGIEVGSRAARDLPVADKIAQALGELADHEAGWGPGVGVEGPFTIARIGNGKLWLTSMAGEDVGPIAVPDDLCLQLHVGRSFSGIVAKRGRKWTFGEVWNIYPL